MRALLEDLMWSALSFAALLFLLFACVVFVGGEGVAPLTLLDISQQYSHSDAG